MCNNCGGQMELISYKWNNDNNTMTYVYRCKGCEDIKEFSFEIKNDLLQEMVSNLDMYNKYNL